MPASFRPIMLLTVYQTDMDAPGLSYDSGTITKVEEPPQLPSEQGIGNIMEAVHRDIQGMQLDDGVGLPDILATFDTEEPLKWITKDRDEWKSKAEEFAKIIDELQKRANANLRANPHLGNEVATRLSQLENENRRLKSDITELRENLDSAEREKSILQNDNSGKSWKLEGASKKVRDAKAMAEKEEEKASKAVQDKQQRAGTERKMRLEKNAALADLAEERKKNEKLTAQLATEQGGHPHMRDAESNEVYTDYTTVVIPIEFKIHRGDFIKLQMVFEANMMKTHDEFERWYTEWKKPKKDEIKVVGANYVSRDDGDKRQKIRLGEDFYEDMTEHREDGDMYIPQTGAEHAGWRSKRGLEDICRRAAYNVNNG
jgi:hypothetical protein